MNKPNWRKTLGEVLNQTTQLIERKSPRTGGTYNVEIVPEIQVRSTGIVEKRVDENGVIKYRYSIVDTKNGLEYDITAPNKVNAEFGSTLIFKELMGGAIGNGNNGWYSAETVNLKQ